MSKAGVFFLLLLWFAACVYNGYVLTQRSFAWIDQPNFGLTPPVKSAQPSGGGGAVDLKNPLQALKNLSPQALLCIRSVLTPDQLAAAMRGQLSSLPADQIPKLMTCLK